MMWDISHYREVHYWELDELLALFEQILRYAGLEGGRGFFAVDFGGQWLFPSEIYLPHLG